MSLIAAAIAAALGWITLAGTAFWYWNVVVPDLYEGDSSLPFFGVMIVAGLAFLGVLIGAIRRTQEKADGLATMVVAAFVLVAIIFSTLTTTGVLLIPGFLASTLAASLPATRPWQRNCASF